MDDFGAPMEGEIPLFDARKEQFSRIVFYLFF